MRVLSNSSQTAPSDWIRINTGFRRSVNLPADVGSERFSFIETHSTIALTTQIVEEIQRKDGDRAWTITGPYGSGKSAFAVFLTHILTGFDDQRTTSLNIKKLRHQALGPSRPFLPVLIQAHRGSLEAQLRERLKVIRNDKRKSRLPLPKLLADTAVRLQRGLLLVVDELGKYLEYANQNAGEDLFLLQQLAELANRSETPIVFIGILHSGFADYATSNNSIARTEFQKVQGRFRDIPFLHPEEHVLELVGSAIENAMPADIRQSYEDKVTELAQGLSQSPKRFCRCLPLHPLTTLMLWPLFRSKLAQNERSIFGFLASFEPFGFRSFFETLPTLSSPTLYGLHDLFDYVTNSLGMAIYSGKEAHEWSSIAEALHRLPPTAPVIHTQLAKCIGLMNLYGRECKLPATDAMLHRALPDYSIGEIQTALNELAASSIVVYRRHDESFHIWDGSDFDIAKAFEETQDRHELAKLSDRMLRYVPLSPIYARAHHIKTGTFRYFEKLVADADTASRVLSEARLESTADGFILFLLDDSMPIENLQEVASALSSSVRNDERSLLVAVPKSPTHVLSTLRDLERWEWLRENRSELAGDNVASAEVAARVFQARNAFHKIAGSTLGVSGSVFDPSRSHWYDQDGLLRTKILNSRAFQRLLSDLCDQTYHKAPVLLNETLNRNSLSTNGSSARRRLIGLILTKAPEDWFEPNSYPPESGMAHAMLIRGGFLESATSEETLRLPTEQDPWYGVWVGIKEFFEAKPDAKVGVQQLYDLLTQPPYGLKVGCMPVLLALLARLEADSFALYEEDVFVPDSDVETFERLVRRPGSFSIRCYQTRQHDNLISALNDLRWVKPMADRGVTRNLGIPDITRLLLQKLSALPRYSLQTDRLPNSAMRLRETLLSAQDPYNLLLEDLPAALVSVEQGINTEEDVATFCEALSTAVNDLDQSFPNLLTTLEASLSDAFGVSNLGGDELTDFMCGYTAKLDTLIEDLTPLSNFIRAIQTGPLSNSHTDWLTRVATAAREGKPPTQWYGFDLQLAQNQISTFGSDCRRLNAMLAKRHMQPNATVANLLIASPGGRIEEISVAEELNGDSQVQTLIGELQTALRNSPSDANKRLIALASLARDLARSSLPKEDPNE